MTALDSPSEETATSPLSASVSETPSSLEVASPSDSQRQNRLKRLLPIKVRVIVHLAEKRIELGQLLGLAPGSLLTFNKNCEDLLDLYINNRLYCRGEAVKIGEKFGLKINELNSRG